MNKDIRQSRLYSAHLERAQVQGARGVPTYNQMGREAGPYLLLGDLYKTRLIVHTAFLVRVQYFSPYC